MVISTSSNISSPGDRSDSGSTVQDIELDKKFADLKARYTKVQKKLSELVVVDRELQAKIAAAKKEMKDIENHFARANKAKLRISSGQDLTLERKVYLMKSDLIDKKLSELDRMLKEIWRETGGKDISDAESKPAPEQKTHRKTREEKMREKLNTKQADNPLAGEFDMLTIHELDECFAESKELAKQLKLSIPLMVVLAAHLNGLEESLKNDIGLYKNCLGEDSPLSLSRPAELESRTNALLKKIAFNLYAFTARIKWLDKISEGARQIVSGVKARSDFEFSLPDIQTTIPEFTSNLRNLISERLTESNLVSKSPGADAVLRVFLSHLSGASAPKNPDQIMELITVLLLQATIKQDTRTKQNSQSEDSSKKLERKDLTRIKRFFHPDVINPHINNRNYSPAMNESLKQAADTFFKIADTAIESAYFTI